MSPLVIGTPAPAELTAWIASPETARLFGRDPRLQADMARLQAELAEIEAGGDPTTCRVCAAPDVTEEHAPSQALGNRGRLLAGKIDPVATRAFGTVTWTLEKMTGGSVVKTLCKRCNSNSGRRFNPAYLRFEEACRPLARPEAAGTLCSVSVAQRPLVAKQVLTWIVATSQPGLTVRYPHVRTLLQRTSARGPLAPLRLWCHLVANPGVTWYTGITLKVNAQRREGLLMASFASWSLGWLLTIGDVGVKGALDVSSWTELEKRAGPATVELPCQWRWRPMPDDFRSAEQILHDAATRRSAIQQ